MITLISILMIPLGVWAGTEAGFGNWKPTIIAALIATTVTAGLIWGIYISPEFRAFVLAELAR